MAGSIIFLNCGQAFRIQFQVMTLKSLVSSWYAVATVPKVTSSKRFLLLLC